ncbi:uncharacterized protein LOC130723795 [Lotus japonicus]|uniref:uncharacterized protein LOC130723795 n=1 Tax=Lotus japonicus TaxID=34305 RepID=UPI00258FA2B9|nr:uncharacterized protein LOC130723795 [Lotus japonicus]
MTTLRKAQTFHAEYQNTKNDEEQSILNLNSERIREQRSTFWKPPQHDTIKINTDAGWDREGQSQSIAVIAGDDQGQPLSRTAKCINASSPLVAEALALREAALLAHNLHWTHVIFESDNQMLIEACKGKNRIGIIYNILMDIKELTKNLQFMSFSWTPRRCNETAHNIADLCKRRLLPPNWLLQPPPSVRRALVQDAMRAWENGHN